MSDWEKRGGRGERGAGGIQKEERRTFKRNCCAGIRLHAVGGRRGVFTEGDSEAKGLLSGRSDAELSPGKKKSTCLNRSPIAGTRKKVGWGRLAANVHLIPGTGELGRSGDPTGEGKRPVFHNKGQKEGKRDRFKDIYDSFR